MSRKTRWYAPGAISSDWLPGRTAPSDLLRRRLRRDQSSSTARLDSWRQDSHFLLPSPERPMSTFDRVRLFAQSPPGRCISRTSCDTPEIAVFTRRTARSLRERWQRHPPDADTRLLTQMICGWRPAGRQPVECRVGDSSPAASPNALETDCTLEMQCGSQPHSLRPCRCHGPATAIASSCGQQLPPHKGAR